MKLKLVVPYRDRLDNSKIFIPHMNEYLRQQEIDYEIWIIEQGNNKHFNKGLLVNAGFLLSKSENSYFCEQDIDLIPMNNEISYKYPGKMFRHPYGGKLDHNLGLLFITDSECFEKCNGFPNNYYGWGSEDINLMHRVKAVNIPIDESNFLYQHQCKTKELFHYRRPDQDETNEKNEKLGAIDNWKENGLSNCKFTVLHKNMINENTFHVIIDF